MRRKLFAVMTAVAIMTSCVPERALARRWMSPCGPSSGGGGEGGVVGLEPAGELFIEQRVSRIERDLLRLERQQETDTSYRVLSDRFAALRRRVRELKALYVSERFRDESIVADLERVGLRLDGMPDNRDITAADMANLEVVRTVHSAYENLARISVFLDQARLGETVAHNDRITFVAHFERLENHPEHGLYWLMCALYRVIVQLPREGARLDAEVVRSIQQIRVVEVDSTSVRHTRDYLVLRDTERALEQMVIDFAALHLIATGSTGVSRF